MNTPIADFINSYISSKATRFHMPGHKGVGDIEKYDITEIAGADVLYSADGIIDESENNATSLFGTEHSFYSTEGSTLAIKAMLYLVSCGKSKTILAARNVHKAFVYGCALLDLSVQWIYPKEFSHLCTCVISANDIKNALSEMSESPCAVYITSPDYLGNIADVEGIAKVCKEKNIPLLVDNAHGAYLNFLSPSKHPIALGAAMCSDSAHKTLPVLTGGAYLHISKDYPEYTENARSALSLFASTSPSYLILRSLDICNKYIEDNLRYELSVCIEKTDTTKETLRKLGFTIRESEPLKIVIDANEVGYSGEQIGSFLRNHGIEAEFCDCEYTVLMTSPKNKDEDFQKLICALSELEIKQGIEHNEIKPNAPKKAMSIREATFAPKIRIAVKDSLGKICASPSVSCPPAVPIAVSGEIIGDREIEEFLNYGIDFVEVVKE
ncbi:MAG: aminotransferase class I/II-fold pyridoxal phosphate-dependent enzyme [Clostridia bacterium]|nr:aminotransferase class I/II-fold pyridoxal phosphate-dependent enzyme [Clostridia bacterium]